jgi:hypothetical protein
MKYIFIILFIPILASCQVVGTGVQVITGSIGCSVNSSSTVPLKVGAVKDISIEFTLVDGGNTLNLSETATCEYQGNMCAGSQWYQVWYGDQSIRREFQLSDGSKITYWPHSFCIDIDDFEKKCGDGACDPSEHFSLNLKFNKEVAEQRRDQDLDWAKGEFSDFDSVNGEKLTKYGYDVRNYLINYGDVAYNKQINKD